MAEHTSDVPAAGDERHAELKKLTVTLYRHRWWVIGCTLFFTIAAGIISFIVTPTYLAETTLVPTRNGSSASLGASAMGRLGGLAGLVGLSGSNRPVVNEAIALLKSRQFTEDFILDKHLLPVLFPNQWNPKLHRWRLGVKVPDLWKGYMLFNRQIRFVDTNPHTGVITLRIEWRNPKQAANWANALVRRVNAQMRQRALSESAKTLRYLYAELKRTNIVPIQNALQELLEETLKKEAFADVRRDYVFTVVDPAAPPARWDKLRPHKLIYVITGFFFGFVLSVLSLLANDGIKTARTWVSESG